MALLMADAITEMGFIVDTVRWLHVRAGAGFMINYQNGEFFLHGKPANLLLDQGHTSNGAAGTAFVAIGCGGIVALWLRHRQLKRTGGISGFTAFFYNFWLYFTAVSAIFSIAAFVYVFTINYTHTGQHIDIAVASRIKTPYPNDSWAPQNWFPALLELDLAHSNDRSDINFHLAIMKGWQWNLIPLVILSTTVAVLAFVDRMRHAQAVNRANGAYRLEAARKQSGSPYS